MRKKICLFSGDITRSGGTERVSVQLANALHRDGNYEICILSLTQKAAQPFYPLEPEIPRYQIGTHWINPGPGYLPVIRKLRRFLKEQQIDLIIDIDIVLDVLSIPASRGRKTKVLSWEHFTTEFELSVWYRKLILNYSVKRSDYVVVLTHGDFEEYHSRLGRNSAIAQIYNAVAYCCAESSGAQREPMILTVGRLVPEKGIRYIQKTALQVLKNNPSWKWVMLGDGPLREELEQFIHANKLQDQFFLMGNVENVDAYLKRAGIFVVASEYEGLGLSMLEARAMGVPCVCFDVKMGPRELIHHGADGYLVTPFDCEEMAEKIETLIQDSDLRRRFAEAALKQMDAFGEEKIMMQWKDILDAL